MKTFTIGRTDDNDIQLSDNSISARHAELVITVGNELYLTDCASSNGTFVQRGDQWSPLRQDFIHIEEQLLFGRFQLGVNDLLRFANDAEQARAKSGIDLDDNGDGDIIEGAVKRDEFGRPIRKE